MNYGRDQEDTTSYHHLQHHPGYKLKTRTPGRQHLKSSCAPNSSELHHPSVYWYPPPQE
ncbi:UNVERIFIED_CONTAM: hypothetical protein Slati_2701200 [Sesamum latifolium]|uniref:Uncharacterized protein n=1 Tax=Sesamum latifolium TaxID=2727402 RepID=A0AAW2VVJ3_9LAMI